MVEIFIFLQEVVEGMIRGKRTFNKGLLRLSIIVFIAGILTLAWSIFTYESEKGKLSELKENISTQIDQDATLSSSEITEIKNLIDSSSKKTDILHLSIYHSENGLQDSRDTDIDDAKYVYLEKEPKSLVEHTMQSSPLNDEWFVRMQLDEKRASNPFVIPQVIFIVFGALILAWLIIDTIQREKKPRLKIVLQKMAIVMLSTILFNLLNAYLNYVPISERRPNVSYFPFWPSVMFYSLYVFPIYLVGGVFSNVIIDNVIEPKTYTSRWLKYIVKLGLYAKAGMVVAFLFVITIGGIHMIKYSLYHFMALGTVASLIYYHISLLFKR